MRPSQRLLQSASFPGFWKRSMEEFKRLSNIAIKLEGLEKPQRSLPLWEFTRAEDVAGCTDMSDSDIGGYSHARFEYVPQSGSEPAHALFSGSISNKLPKDEAEVERTGYAAFRTQDRPPTMFGKSLWNVDTYEYLALRIKADERRYKINLQTESIVYSDLHQHRLYPQRPGKWETVLVRWNDFVRTNHGMVVEPQSEIMKEKVRTVGIGLTDRLPGNFEMRVSRIWATNSLTPEETEEEQEHRDVAYVPKQRAQNEVD